MIDSRQRSHYSVIQERRRINMAERLAEQLHTFAFPFHTIINVTPESPLEEFPLQEISCQTPQNVQAKQEAKADGDSEGLKNSPLRGIQEQKNKEEAEKKLPAIQEKEERKESFKDPSTPKPFIFNEERSPIHLNVEALKPQKEKTGVTLLEDDLIDEDANHLLRYYH